MEAAKWTVRDSVFSDLFQNKKYLLQLYQALHPEDTRTTEEDLTDITIQNVLTDGIYNDLGFRNRDRVMILLEAQSLCKDLHKDSGSTKMKILQVPFRIYSESVFCMAPGRAGSGSRQSPSIWYGFSSMQTTGI